MPRAQKTTGETKAYRALEDIRHNGEFYAKNSTNLSLTDAEAAPLLAIKHIETLAEPQAAE